MAEHMRTACRHTPLGRLQNRVRDLEQRISLALAASTLSGPSYGIDAWGIVRTMRSALERDSDSYG